MAAFFWIKKIWAPAKKLKKKIKNTRIISLFFVKKNQLENKKNGARIIGRGRNVGWLAQKIPVLKAIKTPTIKRDLRNRKFKVSNYN